MTLYLVRAKPKTGSQTFAKKWTLAKYQLGQTLQHSLENARIDNKDGYALWVEVDYCSPPLAMERESVLDRYFDNITVDRIESEQEGWGRINDKPLLWRK